MVPEAIFSTPFIQWIARWPRYSQVGPGASSTCIGWCI